MRSLAPGRGRLIAGTALIGALAATALLSLVWTPEVPTQIRILAKLKPPLAAGLLGTDHLGRDVLSMLMVGARNSLAVALLSVGLGGSFGSLAGIAAASAPGWFDAVTMRVCDALFAFPSVLSAIMLGALLGTGAVTVVLAVGLFMVPVFARLTRGAALQVLERDYILAARMAGKGRLRIAAEHVAPNIVGPILVQASLQLGLAILTEAGLSFLGLGIAPPAPTWGRMLAESQTYLLQAPHLALAPGCAIALAVLGFNLLGDGLGALADPRRASFR